MQHLRCCCTASGAEVSDKRNEEGETEISASWLQTCSYCQSVSVHPYLSEDLYGRASLYMSQVIQLRVWSNFLRVMEVITARAHCSDWSLLVTMGRCDSFWGRVSGRRLSNQVEFRREDVFNQAPCSSAPQVRRRWISWAAPRVKAAHSHRHRHTYTALKNMHSYPQCGHFTRKLRGNRLP